MFNYNLYNWASSIIDGRAFGYKLNRKRDKIHYLFLFNPKLHDNYE